MGQILPNGTKGREILRAATADSVFAALGSDSRYQASNADLTALSGLGTTSFGRQLLTRTDAAAVRSYIGAGTSNSTFDGTFGGLSGVPTTLSGYGITDAQPLDSDLTAIAALSTTGYGRALLTLTDQAALQSAYGATIESALNQTYSSAITWTGTTAPSGTANHRFSWYRIGKEVIFNFRFEWTVAGSALSRAEFPFPSGMPPVESLANQGASEVVCMVSGGLSTAALAGNTNMNTVEARIQLDGSSNPLFWVRAVATNVLGMAVSGSYLCQ